MHSSRHARAAFAAASLATALVLVSPFAAAPAGAATATYTTVHFRAPFAERLVVAEKREHADIQKIGLHVTLPRSRDHVIIASDIPSKIGKFSSPDDMTVVTSGKGRAVWQKVGTFWDMAFPIADAHGRDIGGGLLIIEMPYRYAHTHAEALAKGSAIRDEIQAKIPGERALFKS